MNVLTRSTLNLQISSTNHQIIYSAISKLLSEGNTVDYILIAEVLSHAGDLEMVGRIPYLGYIIESFSMVENNRFYTQAISDVSKLRKLKSLIDTLGQAIGQVQSIENINEMAELGFSNLDDIEDEKALAHIDDSVIEAIH